MFRTDPQQLEWLAVQMKKTAGDSEECWYLLRSLWNEIDLDPDFLARPQGRQVWEHLNEAIASLEILKETLLDLARVLAAFPEQYEAMSRQYVRRVRQIAECAAGLRAVYASVSSPERRREAPELDGAELAPVYEALRRQIRLKGVIRDDGR